MNNNKKLERNPMNKVLGGVCSGLADYFKLDVALVRVLFVIAFLFASFGFWLYVILWIVVPEGKIDFSSSRQPDNVTQTSNDEDRKKLTSVVSGVIVILIGLMFLINNFIPISWIWKLWPLILVVIGVVMVVKASSKGGGDE
ncbi:MAG: PspC domain-containing protein [Bacteroidales bacterium]|nr:PspC domain-containing protein [Bacteroidales bacterium]